MSFFRKKTKLKTSIRETEDYEMVSLLVIDYDSKDWVSLFDQKIIEGESGKLYKIACDQNEWKNLNIVVYDSSSKVEVSMKPNSHPRREIEEKRRKINPQFVLCRQLVCGLKKHQDYRNILKGFLFSNVPSVNSFFSIFMNSERPIVWGALKQIETSLGTENFPLIEQDYYSEPLHMRFTPQMPVVLKFGNSEAGYGKVKVDKPDELVHINGCLTPYNEFVTVEPYLSDKEYDIRVQKIGLHYRAYKRVSASWKSNQGSSVLTEIKVENHFIRWAEEAGKLFGGMEILTVDAIHCKSGKEFIIEINGTASGFYKGNEKEDMGYVVELTIEKMKKLILL